MAKWKVRLINGKYVVGRDQKSSFGSNEFIVPRFGTVFFTSKKFAQKRADKLNS